ncbi:MAG: hypothetical protein ACHQAY_22585 [Hyphomicrobiales bacterium]
MKLIEAVRDLASLNEASTIYASEPWTPSSDVVVAPEPKSGGLPEQAARLDLKYFLEVFIARDFLEGWAANLGKEPTLQEKCARIIAYAITDA